VPLGLAGTALAYAIVVADPPVRSDETGGLPFSPSSELAGDADPSIEPPAY
jgi:hypothetical protein